MSREPASTWNDRLCAPPAKLGTLYLWHAKWIRWQRLRCIRSTDHNHNLLYCTLPDTKTCVWSQNVLHDRTSVLRQDPDEQCSSFFDAFNACGEAEMRNMDRCWGCDSHDPPRLCLAIDSRLFIITSLREWCSQAAALCNACTTATPSIASPTNHDPKRRDISSRKVTGTSFTMPLTTRHKLPEEQSPRSPDDGPARRHCYAP